MERDRNKGVVLFTLCIVVAAPLLCEFAYSPAIPGITSEFGISNRTAQYTISLYLIFFAFGSLSWGYLSDIIGRKKAFISAFVAYITGLCLCYLSPSIEVFMIGRCVQGFGAASTSVIPQCIGRDLFSGRARDRAFSIIGGGVGISFALGGLIGGELVSIFHPKSVLLFAICIISICALMVIFLLYETNNDRTRRSLATVVGLLLRITRNKKVIGMMLIVGISNGIEYSFLGEGSFFCIELLNVSPDIYGKTFLLIGPSWCVGGVLLYSMVHREYSNSTIFFVGISLVMTGTFLMLFGVSSGLISYDNHYAIVFVVMSMMINNVGVGSIVPLCLSVSVDEYKKNSGSAAAIFGFFYYIVNSLTTFILASIRNNTLWIMPIFFCVAAMFMMSIYYFWLRHAFEDYE